MTTARRSLILLAVVLAAALLAWWALNEADAPGALPGARLGTAEVADGPADASKPRKTRDRAGAGTEEAAASPAPPTFETMWPEVGQDRPQDPKLGSVQGRVLAAQEQPVPAALPVAVEASVKGRVVARVRLRGKSDFLLRNVAPGSGIALTARAEGYAPGGADRIVVTEGKVTSVGSVYLGLAIDPSVDNRLVVDVVSGDKPVEGAQVTATTVFYGALLNLGPLEKQPGGTIVRATTDKAGRATFEKLPPASYDVFAEADGLAFEVDQRRVVQAHTTLDLKFDLGAAMTIEGRVETEDAKPVAGAHVVLLRWNTFTTPPPVTTDAEGKFVAGNLTSGSYMVIVAKDDVGGKNVQNVAAGTKDLVVTIPPGAEMWVKCTDAATGAPIRQFSVRPFQKQPFAYLYAPLFEAKTEDGVFRMKLLPASDYGAEVTASGYSLASIATLPLSPPEAFEVKLKASGVVHGRVVEKGTAKPVRGAAVFVKRGGFPPTRMKDQQTVTDAEGAFTLEHLALTPLSLVISHVDRDEATFEAVEPVARAAGGGLPEPRVFELGSGGSVEGRVLGPGGAPETGTTISLLVGFEFLNARSAETDAEGKYAFANVPVGAKYTVIVGQLAPGRGRRKTDVVVTEGQTTVVDFVPELVGQRVTGRILRDDKPVDGATVSIASDEGGQFTSQERTGADGTFAFAIVPAGRYLVRAYGASNAGFRSATVLVKADEAPAEIVMTLATAAISGRVVDASTGLALNGGWADCEQIDPTGSANITRTFRGAGPVSAEGTFSYKGIEDGIYQVRIQRDGFGTELTEPIVIEGGASREGIVISMRPGCTVTGSVRNSRGLAIEGASIRIRDSRGRSMFAISLQQSSGDGTYTQGGLRPDSYEVSFEKDGYAPSMQKVTLAAGAPVTLDFTMAEGGRLEVTVKDGMQAPVKDAVVSLFDEAGRPVQRGTTLTNLFSNERVRTNANGQAVLTGVAAGVYRVSVTPPGAASPTAPVRVEVVGGSLTPVEIVVASPSK